MLAQRMIRAILKRVLIDEKTVLSIEEPELRKPLRVDRPPVDGFVTIVDGHFKSEFDTIDAAEASGRKLKAAR